MVGGGDDCVVERVDIFNVFEELQHVDEEHTPTEHPHIIRFIAHAGSNENLRAEVENLENESYAIENNAVKERLQHLIPEYKPHFD